MKRDRVKTIFNELVAAEVNDKFILRFPDERSAESARTSLYKEKSIWSTQFDNTSVAINRKYNQQKGEFLIELEKISSEFEMFKVSKNGIVEEVEFMFSKQQGLPCSSSVEETETPESLLRQLHLENRPSWIVDSLFESAFPGVNWRELACSLNIQIREE